MDDVESMMKAEKQPLQRLIWFRYFDNMLFIWTHREEKFQSLLNYTTIIK